MQAVSDFTKTARLSVQIKLGPTAASNRKLYTCSLHVYCLQFIDHAAIWIGHRRKLARDARSILFSNPSSDTVFTPLKFHRIVM